MTFLPQWLQSFRNTKGGEKTQSISGRWWVILWNCNASNRPLDGALCPCMVLVAFVLQFKTKCSIQELASKKCLSPSHKKEVLTPHYGGAWNTPPLFRDVVCVCVWLWPSWRMWPFPVDWAQTVAAHCWGAAWTWPAARSTVMCLTQTFEANKNGFSVAKPMCVKVETKMH